MCGACVEWNGCDYLVVNRVDGRMEAWMGNMCRAKAVV